MPRVVIVWLSSYPCLFPWDACLACPPGALSSLPHRLLTRNKEGGGLVGCPRVIQQHFPLNRLAGVPPHIGQKRARAHCRRPPARLLVVSPCRLPRLLLPPLLLPCLLLLRRLVAIGGTRRHHVSLPADLQQLCTNRLDHLTRPEFLHSSKY